MTMTFRDHILPTDPAAIRGIVASTGFFRPDEIDVAVELADERLAKGERSGYFFVFAEQGGRVVGYACYGPIACTVHSHDLYWIAVHNDLRGRGMGRLILDQAERAVVAAGGRRIYVETSSQPQYEPTRSFYLRTGYTQAALLADFYAPGDGKIVLVKAVGGPAGPVRT
jgi:D-alanine-D-alanine ligase